MVGAAEQEATVEAAGEHATVTAEPAAEEDATAGAAACGQSS